MINNEEFSNRLKIILKYYDISAAQLAQKIGVQRSSISHLLSGRNKPSLDFVLKILKAFPKVELYWLMNGVGEFPKEELIENDTSTPTIQKESQIPKALNSEIERIVIFYKDGTFKNFNP